MKCVKSLRKNRSDQQLQHSACICLETALDHLPAALRAEVRQQAGVTTDPVSATKPTLVTVPTLGLLRERWLMAVVGEPNWQDAVQVRRLAGKIGSTLRERDIRFAALAGELPAAAMEVWINGMRQGHYRYEEFKVPKTKPVVPQIAFPAASASTLRRATCLADAIALCRDLINRPAADLGPAEFVRAVQSVAKKVGLRTRVISEKACAERQAGGILAVGAASPRRPRVLVLEWAGGRKKMPADPWALIGKGITFDTGGLQIKPGKAMELMRKDMGGGATVAATMLAIAAMQHQQAVRAYIPLADNAIDGNAFRPGDILRMANGSTVEVGHTDAEGRLVLADAITFARQDGCCGITTVATLTGAALIALGRIHVPVMGSDQDAIQALCQAASRVGEKAWQLPLDDDHLAMVKGTIGTLRNSVGPDASCITAGAFLQHFAGDVPFVHCDISPASWQTGAHALGPAGATGVFVHTLTEWLST